MERLDARIRIVWVVGAVLSAAVAGAVAWVIATVVVDGSDWPAAAVALAVVALGAAFAVFRYRIWRFEIGDDSLYIRRGVLTRVQTVVPFVRVQHVDTQRGPLERVVGLSSVVVYTAGSRGADVTIPGLTPERADDVQEQLRQLAIESEYDDAV